MKNKKLLIGGAVVAGALLFLYFRNKNANGSDQELKDEGLGGGSGTGTTTTTGTGSGTGTTTTTGTGTGSGTGTTPPTGTGSTTPPITQLTKFELEARMLKACGVRPIAKGARRNLYNDCLAREKAILRQQGLISFNGESDDSSRGRLDFGNNVD